MMETTDMDLADLFNGRRMRDWHAVGPALTEQVRKSLRGALAWHP